MAFVLVPTEFRVLEDFPKPVTIGLSPQEFKDLGNSNGLPREALLKREFKVLEDCHATVRHFSVKLKAGEKLTDTRLALQAVKQNRPVAILDTLALSKGMVLPPPVGRAVSESFPDLVKEEQVKEPEPTEEDEDKGGDKDDALKPPPVTPPSVKPAPPKKVNGPK